MGVKRGRTGDCRAADVLISNRAFAETFEKQAPRLLDTGLLLWRRMGFAAPVRAFLSMLLLAAVVCTTAAGECNACGIAQGARVDSGECCQPDGSCDMASSMPGCMKSNAATPALVEPVAQLPQPAATNLELAVTLRAIPVILAEAVPCSTPPLHLLNSLLLI